MAARPSTAERFSALLRPGESVRYVIPVMSEIMGVFTMSPYETVIVVTDERIAVVTGGFARRNKTERIDREFPRQTRLGPVDESLGPVITLGSVQYEIDDDAVPFVAAADAELDGAQA